MRLHPSCGVKYRNTGFIRGRWQSPPFGIGLIVRGPWSTGHNRHPERAHHGK